MSATPNNDEPRQTRLGATVKEIDDALIVMGHLQNRQSQLLKEQAEYVANHEQRLRESEQRNRQTDERIEKLVSAIGEYIRSDREQRGF